MAVMLLFLAANAAVYGCDAAIFGGKCCCFWWQMLLFMEARLLFMEIILLLIAAMLLRCEHCWTKVAGYSCDVDFADALLTSAVRAVRS